MARSQRKQPVATDTGPEASHQPVLRLLEPELLEELESITDSVGVELAHAEFKGGVMRLFIDREDGGVDLSDCETVSKLVSAFLDVVDFSDGQYLLEVSSPGLDRQLYRPKDWVRFTGHRVRVTFIDPESRDKRTVTGVLEAFEPLPEGSDPRQAEGGRATVLVDDTEERLELSLDDVRVGRLEVEI